MLLSFFLQRFYFYGMVTTISFGAVVASGHLLSQMPSSIVFEAPRLIISIIIFVMQHALPYAASAGVQIAVLDVYTVTDDIMIATSKKASHAMMMAVGIYAISLAGVYWPLIAWIIPAEYKIIKTTVAGYLRTHLMHGVPGIVHTPCPQLAILYQEQCDDRIDHIIMVVDTHDQVTTFVARSGQFHDDALWLYDGEAISDTAHKSTQRIHFQKIMLDIALLFREQSAGLIIDDRASFRTIDTLDIDHGVDRLELYKRGAQLLWILILPLLGFFSIMIIGVRHRWGFILALVNSGVWVIVSYLSLLAGSLCANSEFAAVFALYGIPSACGALLICINQTYRKR